MRLRWVIALTAAAVGVAAYAGSVLATNPVGVKTDTIGVGRFTDIDASVKTDVDPGHATDYWQARINTKGDSDLYVIQNTIAPGGTFGWHGHPGPSLVIVKSGTATFYMADDPTCSPHVVKAGQGFVDDGNDTHVVRNESADTPLVTVVASIVPAGFARRIDQPSPGNCSF